MAVPSADAVVCAATALDKLSTRFYLGTPYLRSIAEIVSKFSRSANASRTARRKSGTLYSFSSRTESPKQAGRCILRLVSQAAEAQGTKCGRNSHSSRSPEQNLAPCTWSTPHYPVLCVLLLTHGNLQASRRSIYFTTTSFEGALHALRPFFHNTRVPIIPSLQIIQKKKKMQLKRLQMMLMKFLKQMKELIKTRTKLLQ